MKTNLMIPGLILTALLVCLHAETKTSEDRYQTATVVSVEKGMPEPDYYAGGASDAPLQARTYSYDIGIRLDCDIYVALYQSPIHYLPSDFAPNKTVDVRLQKHVMYVSLADRDWDMKMRIVSHHRIKNESCVARS